MTFQELNSEIIQETSLFLVNHFDVSLIEAHDAVCCALSGYATNESQWANFKRVKEKVPYLSSIITAAGSFDEHYKNALYNGTPVPTSYEERIIEYLEKCGITVPCFD